MDSANTWQRVEELFAEALTLPEDRRSEFVAARCGSDTAAREEIMRLLRARERMGGFLETSMLDMRGQLFGAYRATEEIGRGGMSVVYRGERVDGDFDKRVAIKVVLAQSADAPETQILASLEHPNLARLLDAGTTGLGFRYLVMDYVEGVPCTRFAPTASERQKLALFLQVCSGVQAAHQSLVVHRDLKPENILVTADGTVKLLDFGIAKMLAPGGTQTAGLRAYTIDYASPEQILGYPASTANDIYSLGVLLCELVGGKVPRSLAGLPLDEAVRQPLAIPLTGDLAAVARKALAREPGQRYESAGALARDIERYLANQPIEARPPSWRYLAGKFVGRHRYSVAAGSLAVTALAATAVYAVRQATLADMRFNQVRSLSRSVMFDLHDAVEPLAGSLPARQLIVNRSLQYLDALARDASAGDAVLLDAARGYLRLSEIQGNDNEKASVGESTDALARASQAVALARQVHARSPRNAEAREVLVESLTALSNSHMLLGKNDKALQIAQEAVKTGASGKAAAAAAYVSLGQAYAELGRWPESLPATEKAVALLRENLAADPAKRDAQANLARVLNYISGNYFRSGNKAESVRQNQAALELSKRLYEADPKKYRQLYAADIGTAGALAGEAKRHDDALAAYAEQLKLRREMEAEDPKNLVMALRVATTLDRLGLQYRRAGRFPEAIEWGAQALTKFRAIHAQDTANANITTELYFSLMDLALSYEGAKRMDRACPLASEAVAILDGPIRKSELAYSKVGERARKLAAACGKR